MVFFCISIPIKYVLERIMLYSKQDKGVDEVIKKEDVNNVEIPD